MTWNLCIRHQISHFSRYVWPILVCLYLHLSSLSCVLALVSEGASIMDSKTCYARRPIKSIYLPAPNKIMLLLWMVEWKQKDGYCSSVYSCLLKLSFCFGHIYSLFEAVSHLVRTLCFCWLLGIFGSSYSVVVWDQKRKACISVASHHSGHLLLILKQNSL